MVDIIMQLINNPKNMHEGLPSNEEIEVVEVAAPDQSLSEEEREFENQIAIFTAVMQNAANPETVIKGYNRDGENPFEQKVSDFGDVSKQLEAAQRSLDDVRSRGKEE
jgi:hypothetical protein